MERRCGVFDKLPSELVALILTLTRSEELVQRRGSNTPIWISNLSTLLLVCSTWYHIGIGTPQLFSTIRIKTRGCSQHIHRIRLSVARSKQQPLDIVVQAYLSLSETPKWLPGSLEEQFRILLPERWRWRSLRVLSAGHDRLQAVLRMCESFSPSSSINSETHQQDVTNTSRENVPLTELDLVVLLAGSSRLVPHDVGFPTRKLTLTNVTVDWDTIYIPTLRELLVTEMAGYNVAQFVSMLRFTQRCINLETLKLRNISISPPYSDFLPSSLDLPNLKELELWCIGLFPLEALEVPSLRALTLSGELLGKLSSSNIIYGRLDYLHIPSFAGETSDRFARAQANHLFDLNFEPPLSAKPIFNSISALALDSVYLHDLVHFLKHGKVSMKVILLHYSIFTRQNVYLDPQEWAWLTITLDVVIFGRETELVVDNKLVSPRERLTSLLMTSRQDLSSCNFTVIEDYVANLCRKKESL
jgi:hypothetical protein